MSRRLLWFLMVALLVAPLLAGVAKDGGVFAQDGSGTPEAALIDDGTPDAVDEPTEEPAATETPTETPSPDDGAAETPTESPTEGASPTETGPPAGSPIVGPAEELTVTGTATATATQKPTKTPTPKPTKTPLPTGRLSDLSVTLSCRSNAETIRVTNSGRGYIRVKTIATMHAPLAAEPFHVDRWVRPGKTISFSAGAGASSGTILTKRFILTNTQWDAEGVRINTSVGKVSKRCEARPVPPERWIEINLSTQRLWAWEGNRLAGESPISSGKDGFWTPAGTFYVLVKYDYDTMSGDLGDGYYYVPDVPAVQYFTNEGHALHGAYWHNEFGRTRRSHGCVNMPLDFAWWLYGWTDYGTRIWIHY